jgi:mono/diheme cytochrome c family protein
MIRRRTRHPYGIQMKAHSRLVMLLALPALACSGTDSDGTPLGDGTAPVAGASAAAAGSPGAAGTANSGTSGQPGGVAGGPMAGTGGATAGGATAGGAMAGGGSAGAGGSAAVVPTDGPSYYAAYCQACHGAQGVGGPLAPEIQHPVRDYSSWVVRHGRAVTTFPKAMDIVAPDKISDMNLALVWDYLDLPPQPTTGQALYLDYCGNCHGADGKGGPTTRNILNELAKLKDNVRKGTHPGEFDMRKEYMPAFSTTRLSDAEVNLIYTYVESM